MKDELKNNSALSTQHSALVKGTESQNIEWKQWLRRIMRDEL